MNKPLPASQKVMRQYLKELLTDDVEPDISEKVILKPLERLLENVNKESPALVETKYLK
jgi:hypothetical protein